MPRDTEELLSQLREKGYHGSAISVLHLPDMKREMYEHYEKGYLHQEIFEDPIRQFTFEIPDSSEAQSVIVVAVPLPQVQVVFHWNGKKIPLIIPPTYLNVRKNCEKIETLFSELDHPVLRAHLPEKLVAVHSGLAQYGRNNITYVPGMGSFYRPFVFYSDLPGQDNWEPIQKMKACEHCDACVEKCPTGAITEERFLLRAELCLTLHNEHPGTIPFPQWIDPSWHNCLVGCLHCQSVCPVNKRFLKWVERGPEFSEEETNLLLKGAVEELSQETAQKIEQFQMEDLLDIVPRNLKVFLT